MSYLCRCGSPLRIRKLVQPFKAPFKTGRCMNCGGLWFALWDRFTRFVHTAPQPVLDCFERRAESLVKDWRRERLWGTILAFAAYLIWRLMWARY